MRLPSSLTLSAAIAILGAGASSAPAAPPTNDDIALASVVAEPLPFSEHVTTIEATTAPGDPDCVGNGPTVWFTYVPSANGWVDSHTFGSDYDTTLSVYTGTPSSLIQLACNDDSMSLQSRVIFEVRAGTRYYFMVGAYASGPGGNLAFTVNEGVPPVAVDVVVLGPPGVMPSTGTASVRVGVRAGEPVPLLFLSANLVQRSGRGHVIAFSSSFLGELTDELELSLTLKDTTSARARGTGFVGGPANIVVELVYEDPAQGIQFKRIEQEVKLKGGNVR